MGRSKVMAFCLAATACSDRVLTFELPPLDGARSAIFAFHLEERFEVRAVDLELEGVSISVPVDLGPDDEGSIEALVFDEPLQDLRIPPGTLGSAEIGAPIPASEDSRFIANFRGAEPGAWTPTGQRSEQLEEFRTPFDDTCAKFSIVGTFNLDSGTDHAFTLPLGPERAIEADIDGKMYVVEPDGVIPITDVALPRPLTDVLVLEDGTILFSGELGRIWTGRIETSTTPSGIRIEGDLLTTVPGGERIMRFAGGREGGTLELFATTNFGGVHRFDGSTWTQFFDFDAELSTAVSVVRPRPGVAYVSTDESNELARYRDGIVDSYPPPDLSNGLPKLVYFPEYGYVASRSEGGLFHLPDDDAAWELLVGSPIALNVFAFEWLDDGFIFAGAFGFFSQYRVGTGYCPSVQLASGSIREIIPFGDGYLLGEDKPQSRDKTQVSIVKRE